MADPKTRDIAGHVLDSLSQAQIELDSLRRELEESHRLALVGTMAAGLAHEINNLLTPVLAHAQLAAARPGDLQMQADTLKKVMRGVKDAASLTRTILGLAGDHPDTRVDAHGARAQRAAIRQVVDAATNCLVRAPEKDGIEFTNRVRPNLAARMEPILLQQVLLNLILNAQRALARRGGRITIDANEIDGDSIEISVTDNGPGIPTEMVDRLFEPLARRRASRARKTGKTGTGTIFAQEKPVPNDASPPPAEVATSRRDADAGDPFDAMKRQASNAASSGSADPAGQGGCGLGLATCRLLIEHAHGRIAVRSTPGRGSIFTITLPRADPAAAHRAAG